MVKPISPKTVAKITLLFLILSKSAAYFFTAVGGWLLCKNHHLQSINFKAG